MWPRCSRKLLTLLEQGQALTANSVGQTIDMIKHEDVKPSEVLTDVVLTSRGRSVAPKSLGQKRYVDALRRSTLTFSIGPAGTGKTYLVAATAVRALQEREVNRIILTRLAVEAGEKLAPARHAVREDRSLHAAAVRRPVRDDGSERLPAADGAGDDRSGAPRVPPGRTLNDSFIILDEAQNTSPEQMKMFHQARLRSRAAVNGDITQIDLPPGQRSGLVVVQEILRGIEGVEFTHLGARDVVRHRIVQDIVEAYRRYGEEQTPAGPADSGDRRPE